MITTTPLPTAPRGHSTKAASRCFRLFFARHFLWQLENKKVWGQAVTIFAPTMSCKAPASSPPPAIAIQQVPWPPGLKSEYTSLLSLSHLKDICVLTPPCGAGCCSTCTTPGTPSTATTDDGSTTGRSHRKVTTERDGSC